MKRVALLILLPLLSACGSSPSAPTPAPPAPTPTRAAVTVAVSPSPVIATPSDPGCPDHRYGSIWTTAISETAGVSGNVNFINITRRNPLGFELSTVSYDVNEIIRRAGTNHVNARGQISVRMGVCHGDPRQSRVVQVVNFTDDLGNVLNVATEFDVL